MRVYLFSDVHCNRGAAQRIVDAAGNADVAIGAGDFASVHRGLEETIDALKPIRVPTVLVPGNNERLDALRSACEGWSNATILHGESATIAGRTFFGIGGGIPMTPFGAWSFDFTEEEAAQMLSSCPDHAIIVSHSPPFGAADLDSSGSHRGSSSVREAAIRTRADLVVCGHIHHSAGTIARLEGSWVINPGPAGVLWDLEATVAV